MNQRLGKEGEDLAVQFLRGKGYKILERNFRTPYGEIDIICELGGACLVFVEVKTRSSQKFGLPQEAITAKKISHLKKAAYLYLNSREKPFKSLRFDVISILIRDGRKQLEHIESAF